MEKYLTVGISFYLDGAAYRLKHNPCKEVKPIKAMTLRQRVEGLDSLYIVKGSHTGVMREHDTFLWQYSLNWVILHQKYSAKINEEMFAEFMREHFREVFRNNDKAKDKTLSSRWWPIKKQQKSN